jgi:hypothetical protein
VNHALVAKKNVRHEEREELHGGEELVIAAQGRVEVALEVNEPVRSIIQSLKGDGCALHVFEDGLEPLSVVCLEPAAGVDVKAGAAP